MLHLNPLWVVPELRLEEDDINVVSKASQSMIRNESDYMRCTEEEKRNNSDLEIEENNNKGSIER